MISAIIPIRAVDGEQPELALREDGTSWLQRKLDVLRAEKTILEIVISTDSRAVVAALENEIDIRIHNRAGERDQETFAGVVRAAATFCNWDTIAWLFANQVNIDGPTLADIIETYMQLDQAIYDSLVTCTAVREYFFDENGPINFATGAAHKERRNLYPLYMVRNGCFVMKRAQNIGLGYPWGRVPYRYILAD